MIMMRIIETGPDSAPARFSRGIESAQPLLDRFFGIRESPPAAATLQTSSQGGTMQFDQVLSPASPQAHAISLLFVYMLVIAAIILTVVAGLVIYIVIRYRGRPGDAEPRQVSGNRTLEIIWTAIPLAIVTSLVVFTIHTMRVVDPAAGRRKPDLVIIAHQWWWEIHYPRSGVVTANEVHMPVGEHWLVQVESADVIHDFWVPRLGRKIDAIRADAASTDRSSK